MGHFACTCGALGAELLWVKTLTGLRMSRFELLVRAAGRRNPTGTETYSSRRTSPGCTNRWRARTGTANPARGATPGQGSRAATTTGSARPDAATPARRTPAQSCAAQLCPLPPATAAPGEAERTTGRWHGGPDLARAGSAGARGARPRPEARCAPSGPRRERIEWAAEFTRKLWGRRPAVQVPGGVGGEERRALLSFQAGERAAVARDILGRGSGEPREIEQLALQIRQGPLFARLPAGVQQHRCQQVDRVVRNQTSTDKSIVARFAFFARLPFPGLYRVIGEHGTGTCHGGVESVLQRCGGVGAAEHAAHDDAEGAWPRWCRRGREGAVRGSGMSQNWS